MNADGRTDVVDNDAAMFKVALSTGAALNAPSNWGVAQAWVPEHISCQWGGVLMGTGDFNGDGLTDVYCRNGTSTDVFVGLSNGAQLSFSVFLRDGCDGYGQRNGAIDFDGASPYCA